MNCGYEHIRIMFKIVFGAGVLLSTWYPTTLTLAQPDSDIRYTYAIFQLPTLGGINSYGWALNNAGIVVGSSYLSYPDYYFHATAWIDGTPYDVGTLPGGHYSAARGINESNWIIGWASPLNGEFYDHAAFLWRNGKMVNLGTFGGDFAEAYGINDLDQIVGWAATDNTHETKYAFIWQDGILSQLNTPSPYTDSEAIAINNAGIIVGQSFSDYYTTWRPVIWMNGTIHDLGTFRNDNSGTGICIDVNEAGDVVGYANDSYDGYRAFVSHNDHMYPLPELPRWIDSYAWSINDRREIVGQALITDDPPDFFGCIWKWDRRPRPIVDLIPPNADWYIESAIDNNDLSQITGTGFRLSNPTHIQGYLITPIHQTIQLSRAQPGTAGAVNTLKVHGAMPGAQVTFIYGDKGGGSAIPGCTLEENALQIDSPIILATITANANGVAELRGYVPSGARGRTVLIQAFVQGECGVSQLVVQRFE